LRTETVKKHKRKRTSSTMFSCYSSIEKFELSLPFNSIRIGTFNNDLMEIEETDGETKLGYVLFDKFRYRMTNSVWKKALSTRNSMTS